MTRIGITLFLLILTTWARAEGTFNGRVQVHGHVYPLHPVTIRVFDPQTGELLPQFTTENDADGRYEISGLPAGEYKLHFDAHGDVWRYLDTLSGVWLCDNAACDIVAHGDALRVEDGETVTYNPTMVEGVMMTGTVRDDGYHPLAGATVEFFDEHGNPHCCDRITDENGEWARPLYFPASYYVRARYTDPSKYRPKVYSDRDCSGCDVAATGSRITFDYYWSFIGLDLRLTRVEPDPDIEVESVARHKYSGSWFDPEREGEGFIVEVLDRPGPEGNGHEVVVFWFTYDHAGNQVWMVGTGALTGQKADVEFEITRGAVFGEAFDAEDVVREHWGSMEIRFLNCGNAHAQYAGEFGSGQIDLGRLSNIEGLGCGDPDDGTVPAEEVISGAWFNPERDGEGFILERVDEARLLAYWFTYDTDGSQMWMLGTGEIDGDRSAVVNMLRSSGGKFGDELEPEEVQLNEWGDVVFEFDGCSNASYSWTAAENYGSGGFDISRLTELRNAECLGH